MYFGLAVGLSTGPVLGGAPCAGEMALGGAATSMHFSGGAADAEADNARTPSEAKTKV